MKKLFLFFALSLLMLASVGAQTQQGGGPPKQWLVGEVTAVDAAARQVAVRSDAGETVTISVTDQTKYTRMPPGETNPQKGAPATLADVHVGERVLALDFSAAGGTATRILVMERAAGGQQRDDGRRLGGRVVSTDPSKKLIVVQARGRDGAESVTIDASGGVRFLRLAPDSQRPADAQPGSFADIKPGDSVRATGTRATDGGPFKAEEVVSGSVMRFIGTVGSVDASRGALTVKNELTGQNVTLTFGSRSTLRRVTPEFEQEVARQRAEFAQRREQREQRRAAGEGGQAQGEGGERRRGEGERRRGDGERGGGDGERRGPDGAGRRGAGRGGNFQQMFDSLPTVTLAELKKGDSVVVTATPSSDASRATVVTLVTGAAEFLRGMQQFQGGGPRGMSPGLPGDVMGGGQGGTREPPR
jgi:hypothetical protein